MLEEKIKKLKKIFHTNSVHVSKNGTVLLITEMLGAVDLYLNPNEYCGAEERYRFLSLTLAKKAVDDFDLNNTLKYWSSHTNKGFCIKGSKAYTSAFSEELDGLVQIFEFDVDWNINELEKEYN
jgi:hypothetical protein